MEKDSIFHNSWNRYRVNGFEDITIKIYIKFN